MSWRSQRSLPRATACARYAPGAEGAARRGAALPCRVAPEPAPSGRLSRPSPRQQLHNRYRARSPTEAHNTGRCFPQVTAARAAETGPPGVTLRASQKKACRRVSSSAPAGFDNATRVSGKLTPHPLAAALGGIRQAA